MDELFAAIDAKYVFIAIVFVAYRTYGHTATSLPDVAIYKISFLITHRIFGIF